jgi:hypothetical protein
MKKANLERNPHAFETSPPQVRRKRPFGHVREVALRIHPSTSLPLTAALILTIACSAPKFTHPEKATRPVTVSLPGMFSPGEATRIEQQFQPLLERWPRGTTLSIAIQPVTVDPNSNLAGTWSDSIGNGSQAGWEAGAVAGEVVDLLFLKGGFFRATVGAVGFLIGGTAGAIAGPFTQAGLNYQAQESHEFNFIAGIRIQSPGAAPINMVQFDLKNYPVKPPADKGMREKVQHDSLAMLVTALEENLRDRTVSKGY